MLIHVSDGELLDKYSILEIKKEKIKEINKLNEIEKELNVLKDAIYLKNKKIYHYKILKWINEKIWDFTDNIKKLHYTNIEYSKLSSIIFEFNQYRFRLKNFLNFDSDLKEQKSFSQNSISFNILEKIHNINNDIIINNDNIYNNYIIKVKNRFNNIDYFFDDNIEIFNKIIELFEKYYAPKITSTIHGDFWFSNILLDYNDNYKLIDMKGQVDNILTLNGDIYYDYAKLYQSILGFDLILNDNEFDEKYILSIKEYFLEKCVEKYLNIDYLNIVCILNIFGSMHSFETNEIKIKMWKFIKTLV